VSGDMGDAFKRASSPKAHVRREGLPDPSKVADKGIKTKEALDWLALEAPDDPEPAYEIDDETLKREVSERTTRDQRNRVKGMREQMRATARKGRTDFETARSWRDQNRER